MSLLSMECLIAERTAHRTDCDGNTSGACFCASGRMHEAGDEYQVCLNAMDGPQLPCRQDAIFSGRDLGGSTESVLFWMPRHCRLTLMRTLFRATPLWRKYSTNRRAHRTIAAASSFLRESTNTNWGPPTRWATATPLPPAGPASIYPV
jgi:hypothetical protein